MAATQTDKTEMFRGRAYAQKTLRLCYSASSALKTKTIRFHNFADVANVAWANRFAARPLLYMFLPVLHGWNTHPLFRVLLTQNQNSGEGPWGILGRDPEKSWNLGAILHDLWDCAILGGGRRFAQRVARPLCQRSGDLYANRRRRTGKSLQENRLRCWGGVGINAEAWSAA